MPEFSLEKALVLSAKRLGERSWILSLFSREQGRILGVYQKKQPPETGVFVTGRWRARLAEQLGNLYLEESNPFVVRYLDDYRRLACISSLCALLDDFLPERQSFADLYDSVCHFFEQFDEDTFLKNYVLLERDLLSDIGFGLDTSSCAGGGDARDLAYISPKTGRAVSREKGKPYHNKLLILPKFLWTDSGATNEDIQNGLILIGYFLTQHSPKHRLPITRQSLLPR